jgi:hypothetical protein
MEKGAVLHASGGGREPHMGRAALGVVSGCFSSVQRKTISRSDSPIPLQATQVNPSALATLGVSGLAPTVREATAASRARAQLRPECRRG